MSATPSVEMTATTARFDVKRLALVVSGPALSMRLPLSPDIAARLGLALIGFAGRAAVDRVIEEDRRDL